MIWRISLLFQNLLNLVEKKLIIGTFLAQQESWFIKIWLEEMRWKDDYWNNYRNGHRLCSGCIFNNPLHWGSIKRWATGKVFILSGTNHLIKTKSNLKSNYFENGHVVPKTWINSNFESRNQLAQSKILTRSSRGEFSANYYFAGSGYCGNQLESTKYIIFFLSAKRINYDFTT